MPWWLPTFRKHPSSGVHLTFDDGPDPCCTAEIAALLEERGHRATFFLLGRNVGNHPDVVRKLSDAGHTIGIHGFEHRSLAFVPRRRLQEELLRCLAEVRAILPAAEVKYLRPPFGRVSPALLLVARNLELEVVLWNCNPRDYACPTPDALVQRFRRSFAPGSIVLLHDAPPGGPVTLAALPRILESIEATGLPILPL